MPLTLAGRFLAGVVVAAAVGLGGYSVVSAALGATSDEVGAGDQTVSSCDTSFVIDSLALNGSNEVTAVTVSDIAAACVGGALTIDLTKADNVSVGSGGPITVTSTLPLTVSIAGPPPAASLVKHEVIIIVGP